MQFASTLDLLPTIFNLVGATIPNDRVIDGYDMAPILFKRGFQHESMQHKYSTVSMTQMSAYTAWYAINR